MIEKLKELAKKSITYQDFECAVSDMSMKKVLEAIQDAGYPDLVEFYNANCQKNVFLTPQEVADILKVSVHKLRVDRLLGRGIPFYRLGNDKHSAVRYKYADVIEYLEKNKSRGER